MLLFNRHPLSALLKNIWGKYAQSILYFGTKMTYIILYNNNPPYSA